MIEDENTFQKLKNRSEEFKKFCLGITDKYAKFSNDLEDILDIKEQVLNQLKLAKEQNDVIKVSEFEKEFQDWKIEENDYFDSCTKIKDRLVQLGIVSKNQDATYIQDNTKIVNNVNKKINSMVQFFTYYQKMKKNIDFDAPIDEVIHEVKKMYEVHNELNRLYQSTFITTDEQLEDDDLIPPLFDETKETKEEYEQTLEQFYHYEDQNKYDSIFESYAKEDNDSDDLIIPSKPEIEPVDYVELEQTLNQKFEEKINNSLEAIQKTKEIEEPSIPSFLNEYYETSKKETMATNQKVIDEAMIKRKENYDHYLKQLYANLDEYAVAKMATSKAIQERIMNNESFLDLENEYEKKKDIYNLVFKEVQRISGLKQNLENVHYNLNIPNLDMPFKEVLEYLKNNKDFPFEKLPKTEEKSYPLLSGIKEDTPDNNKDLPEDLQAIMRYKKAGLTNEEIRILLSQKEKTAKKEAFLDTKVGKAYKWVRSASQKTKEFVQKKKYIILGAGALALLLIGGSKIGNNKASNASSDNSYAIETTAMTNDLDNKNLANSSFGEDEKFKINPPIEIAVTKTSPFDDYEFGDYFVIAGETQIYKSEYLEGADSPSYSSDTKRSIEGFGIRDEKGEVHMAYNMEEKNALLSQGGEYVSVKSFDGFFNIEDIIVLEKGLER